MSDTIKCNCPHCGAKYRLPLESQGKFARCKQCGEKFQVQRPGSALEDSVLAWLSEPEGEEEAVAQPRVISMPHEHQADPELTKKAKGVIRMKSGTAEG